MRTISGYVMVCENSVCTFLFGEPTDDTKDRGFENIQTNGLVPFTTLKQARSAVATFSRGKYFAETMLNGATAKVGFLELEIALDRSEFDALSAKHRASFVVIYCYGEDIVSLLGKYIDGSVREFDSGGLMVRKAVPFENFKEAVHLACEATRQGQAPAAVAHYRLDNIR